MISFHCSWVSYLFLEKQRIRMKVSKELRKVRGDLWDMVARGKENRIRIVVLLLKLSSYDEYLLSYH